MPPTGLPDHVALPDTLRHTCVHIARLLAAHGGKTLLVGGAPRDTLLGRTAHDADLEIYHIAPDTLPRLLAPHYPLDHVGKAFGIYKIRNHPIDIALPRKERKTGTGHQAFAIESDPDLPYAQASLRRDFTINTIAWDPLTHAWHDPHNGIHDLRTRTLRHTSQQFAEDPLRVLRAMQFIARFELTPTPQTLALCASITPENLPQERLFDEWRKLLLLGAKPSLGLTFLRQCGWLRYYPELEALIGCPQDPQWHPEGDVWTHTLHALDATPALRTDNAHDNLIVGLATLCHDLGKPATTHTAADGHIRSPGHEIAGLDPARQFLERLTRQQDLIAPVLLLVETHDRPWKLHQENATDAAIRRLARKVQRLDLLIRVSQADTAGRPPKAPDFPAGPWLLERAQRLQITQEGPRPLLQGRHLVALGYTPGPHFGPLLKQLFEHQLDGAYTDESGALAHLDTHLREQQWRPPHGPPPAPSAP